MNQVNHSQEVCLALLEGHFELLLVWLDIFLGILPLLLAKLELSKLLVGKLHAFLLEVVDLEVLSNALALLQTQELVTIYSDLETILDWLPIVPRQNEKDDLPVSLKIITKHHHGVAKLVRIIFVFNAHKRVQLFKDEFVLSEDALQI